MADTIASWFSAVATALAVIAAVWAGVTARKVYAIEEGRERDRQLSDQQRQAELVASWVSWTDQPKIAIRLPDGRTDRANLAMKNASVVPVYDVEVAYTSAGALLGVQTFHILSPTGSAAHYREIKCPGVADLLAQPRASDARVDIRVTISFTDARGVRWTRDGAGHLGKATAH